MVAYAVSSYTCFLRLEYTPKISLTQLMDGCSNSLDTYVGFGAGPVSTLSILPPDERLETVARRFSVKLMREGASEPRSLAGSPHTMKTSAVLPRETGTR